MDVLVADVKSFVALVVIRSLGKKGIDVDGATNSKNASALYSRYCRNGVLYNPDKNDNNNLVSELFKIVESNNYDVFLPVFNEDVLLLLSQNKKKFERYTKLPIADYDVLETSSNKSKIMKIAEDINIPYPLTYFVDEVDKIDDIRNELSFPVVVKPSRSFGAKGLFYVYSTNELKEKFLEIKNEYGSVLIQEYIPGIKYTVNTLFNKNSEPIRVVVHKCIRQFPVSGGVFTLGETIHMPSLVEYAFKLLRHVKYCGVACVEFVIDERDGTPKLIEINPRFYGSLALSIGAGVDYPYLLAKMALEEDIEESLDYNFGIKYRNLLWGDVKHLIYSLMGRVGPNYKIGKIQTLINFLKFHEDDGYYILSKDDPKPAIIRVKNTITDKLCRVNSK